jgi:O-acetyl-ADP-ribose deacetylase
MQRYLHNWLASTNQRLVRPGDIVVAPRCGSSFKVVVHAVAVDAFYDTSPEIIGTAYESSFAALSNAGCRTVAAACLACGYGRASPPMFVNAVKQFFMRALPGIDRVEFVSTDLELIDVVQSAIESRTD